VQLDIGPKDNGPKDNGRAKGEEVEHEAIWSVRQNEVRLTAIEGWAGCRREGKRDGKVRCAVHRVRYPPKEKPQCYANGSLSSPPLPPSEAR
jgi:hypothetical protein